VEKDQRKKTNPSEPQTTGHEWDGIKEYDNPDPFWLRLMFYCALFFSLGYWLFYPSWPSQYGHGIFDWSQYKELEESQKEIIKRRAVYLDEFNKASFDEIMKNPELYKFAIAGGKSAFANNCAVCHGIGGGGNPGYPNLTAGAWLWGGKPEDIYQTIKFGIRSGHEETRDSQMAAFGRDGILKPDEVNILTDFVMGMYKGQNYSDQANELYQKNCASCHGVKGEGKHEFGGPALNDAIWLYGSDKKTIHDVIYNGRQGVMPQWFGRLSDSTIRELVVYVHGLGGGE
jgi:cytochrome c oxidase cbb3-type subunit 3